MVINRTELCKEYLAWVRKRPCVICFERAEPHHMLAIGMGRNRKRTMVEHLLTLALCRTHHIEFDHLNVSGMNEKHQVDLWKMVALQEAEFWWDWMERKEHQQ